MPEYIGVFADVIRGDNAAQVATVAVFALIFLDVVFGIVNAVAHGEFKSEKMRAGIAHKCAELGFMAVGVVIDGVISSGIDIGGLIGADFAPVYMFVCAYLCVMEVGSLLEIFAKMNPALAESPIFGRILKVLESVHPKEAQDG